MENPAPTEKAKKPTKAERIAVWEAAQVEEVEFWSDYSNHWFEVVKQQMYAEKMKVRFWEEGYNVGGHSILDVGGGPCSMLLHCFNAKRLKVIDPQELPAWAIARYEAAGIEYERIRAEDMVEEGWTDVWMYNVLQHVVDPKVVVQKARKAGGKVRFFDWIDTPVSTLHPHSLSADVLRKWFGRDGGVEIMEGQNYCYGPAFFGVFPKP